MERSSPHTQRTTPPSSSGDWWCDDCDSHGRPDEAEAEDRTVGKFLDDLAGSDLFPFVLEGHELPEDIRERWEGLQARLIALTGEGR